MFLLNCYWLNRRTQIFLKGIITEWNVNSLVHDVNSGRIRKIMLPKIKKRKCQVDFVTIRPNMVILLEQLTSTQLIITNVVIMTPYKATLSVGFRIHWWHLLKRSKTLPLRTPPPKKVIWEWHWILWWVSSPTDLGNVKYPFMAITPRSTMIRSGTTYSSLGECRVPLHCHRSQVHSGPEW